MLKEELLDAVEPAKILILDTLKKKIVTKSGEIYSFEPANAEEMYELEKVLKEIQPDFDLKEMTQKSKVELSDYNNLHNAINDHCVLGHYMFSFRKCSNDGCSIPHICGEKLLENKIISTLHHLPFPMLKQSEEKFRPFNELYGSATNENHRPGRFEKEASSHQMPFPPSSQNAKNTGVVVQCDE